MERRGAKKDRRGGKTKRKRSSERERERAVPITAGTGLSGLFSRAGVFLIRPCGSNLLSLIHTGAVTDEVHAGVGIAGPCTPPQAGVKDGFAKRSENGKLFSTCARRNLKDI